MEGALSTKERIVYESLRLFSQKGYDGVSMREIASAVGIKGASIYNHFKGKEDIFNAIFTEMMKRYDNAAAKMSVPAEQDSETVAKYMKMDESQMMRIADDLFSFFVKDKFAVSFRKLLVSEQHKSKLASKALTEYYLEAPIVFQTRLFEGMQQCGAFLGYDPAVMALHFYSPMYYLLEKYDMGCSYEECMELISKHIHWFCKLYQKLLNE